VWPQQGRRQTGRACHVLTRGYLREPSVRVVGDALLFSVRSRTNITIMTSLKDSREALSRVEVCRMGLEGRVMYDHTFLRGGHAGPRPFLTIRSPARRPIKRCVIKAFRLSDQSVLGVRSNSHITGNAVSTEPLTSNCLAVAYANEWPFWRPAYSTATPPTSRPRPQQQFFPNRARSSRGQLQMHPRRRDKTQSFDQCSVLAATRWRD
jgi:hypothetical protein